MPPILERVKPPLVPPSGAARPEALPALLGDAPTLAFAPPAADPAAPDPAVEAPVSAEVLDMLRGIEAAGEPGFYRELVDIFLADLDRRLAELRQGVGAGRLDVVRGVAHSLKGSSGNLGAFRLSHYCGTMEHRAQAGDLPAVAAGLDDLGREAGRVREFFLAERDASA